MLLVFAGHLSGHVHGKMKPQLYISGEYIPGGVLLEGRAINQWSIAMRLEANTQGNVREQNKRNPAHPGSPTSVKNQKQGIPVGKYYPSHSTVVGIKPFT